MLIRRRRSRGSRALAWAAVDRGFRLAEDTGRTVPEGWRRAREEIRAAIESKGYERRGGIFVQSFCSSRLDAALLRLPTVGVGTEAPVLLLGRVAAQMPAPALVHQVTEGIELKLAAGFIAHPHRAVPR
jgi:Glycosyl hydrolases family 15